MYEKNLVDLTEYYSQKREQGHHKRELDRRLTWGVTTYLGIYTCERLWGVWRLLIQPLRVYVVNFLQCKSFTSKMSIWHSRILEYWFILNIDIEGFLSFTHHLYKISFGYSWLVLCYYYFTKFLKKFPTSYI